MGLVGWYSGRVVQGCCSGGLVQGSSVGTSVLWW